MLQELYRAWKRKQSVMVQMPTGTGKTVLMAEVISEACRVKNLLPGKHPKSGRLPPNRVVSWWWHTAGS